MPLLKLLYAINTMVLKLYLLDLLLVKILLYNLQKGNELKRTILSFTNTKAV